MKWIMRRSWLAGIFARACNGRADAQRGPALHLLLKAIGRGLVTSSGAGLLHGGGVAGVRSSMSSSPAVEVAGQYQRSHDSRRR
jgi:hypothetical protein